ncbi:MAG: hypothetical protein V3V00_09045 [Saprospiraceae bacterium]
MNSRIYIFLFLLISSIGYSQNGNNGLNSPFSRFGLGDLNDPGFMHLRQMGNITASFADGHHINVVNPASYAFLQATSFELGLETRLSSYNDGKVKESTASGGLSYMALAFPLKNPINNLLEKERSDFSFGMSFHMLPVSTVAYNISFDEESPDFGRYKRSFTGEGGVYKVGWGGAIKYKRFSAGVNLGFNFGKISNERFTTFLDDLAAYNNVFISDFNVKGFDYKLGIIYQHILNKDLSKDVSDGKTIKALNFGVTGKTKTSFTGTEEIFFRNQLIPPILQGAQYIDTLTRETISLEGSKMPSEFSFGVTYLSGAKFALGINYGFRRWSEYINPATPITLSNTTRYSVGGYYRPDPSSISSFFKRVYYRFGLYYKEDPRSINAQNIDTYGVSVGLGLPFIFQRKISHLSIGFDYGTRGTVEVLKENFFKISLGFTFNDDEWFIKRKFN